MKVIPFNIKYRPEIESGEKKVVNGKGKSVTILRWDMQGNYPLLGVVMTNITNYEGDESWEEERPFAYSAEGFPSSYIPANKGELHILIDGEDKYTLEGILETMLDYAKTHAKPDAEVAKIFRDNVYDFVRNDVIGNIPQWTAVSPGNYILETHLGKKKDGTFSLFTDHTLNPEEVEYVVSVDDLDKLPKIHPSRINSD